jgi:hypothetical protein
MDEKGGKGKGNIRFILKGVEVTTWKYSKPIMHNDYGNFF